MNLDFYPGQKVECIESPYHDGIMMFVSKMVCGVLVKVGEIYTVAGTMECQCPSGGCFQVLLEEVPRASFCHKQFRPLEPVAMKELRGLLAPSDDGGGDQTVKELETEDA